VNSDPAKVAVFLIIQTTSSPLTSETYIRADEMRVETYIRQMRVLVPEK
jgi:hypothetical protein